VRRFGFAAAFFRAGAFFRAVVFLAVVFLADDVRLRAGMSLPPFL
jgi:hypothetical protein